MAGTATASGPFVNEFGVIVEYETVEIPIRKTTKATAELQVVEHPAGEWRLGETFDGPNGGGGHDPNVAHDPYPSRVDALVAGCRNIERHFASRQGLSAAASRRAEKAVEDVAKFRATLEAEQQSAAADWTCSECACINDAGLVWCGGCEARKPRPSPHDETLAAALTPNDENETHWHKLHREGAGDGVLQSAIATALEQNFSDCCATDLGDCCWTINDRAVRLWFDCRSVPKGRVCDLEGRELLQAVRGLFAIGKPGRRADTNRNGRGANQSGRSVNQIGAETPQTVPPVNQAAADESAGPPVVAIPLDRIEPDPDNRNWRDDPEAVEEAKGLAKSIELHGQLQAAGVRPIDDGRYRLIFGEGRYHACHFADGVTTLDARVFDVDEVGACELRLDENVRRRTLNPIDKLRDLARLVEYGKANGTTMTEVARRYGMTKGGLSNQLRVLQLPEPWLQLFSAGNLPLSYGHKVLCEKWLTPELFKLIEPLRKAIAGGDEPRSAEDFRSSVIYKIQNCTKPMSGWQVQGVRFTKAERERLDVVEIPVPWGDGMQEVALRTREWSKVVKAKKGDTGGTASTATTTTATARKETAADKRRRWDRQLDEAWDRWYATRLADYLGSEAGEETALPLLVFLLIADGEFGWSIAPPYEPAKRSKWVRSLSSPATIVEYYRSELVKYLREAAAADGYVDLGTISLFCRSHFNTAAHDPEQAWRASAEFLEGLDEDLLKKAAGRGVKSADTAREKLLSTQEPGVPKALQPSWWGKTK